MRYASFTPPSGQPTWGICTEGRVHDLGPSGLQLADSLRDAVAQGWPTPPETWQSDAPAFDEDEVTFLPPITDPAKVICVGVNYRSHQQETGKTEQKAPTIFFRFADSQMGHQQPALYPSVSKQFDYEGEVALVIGKDAWRVSEADAFDHVAGLSCYNDFSVRDWQRITTQWGPGKTFPGTGGFGPYLVPMTDIDDLDSMQLETRVNGEVRQQATLADLYFSIPQIIAYVTTFTPLKAGDVIVTGTPGGVGLFMDPPGLLKDGDVVEVEVTHLGTLRNTVRAEA